MIMCNQNTLFIQTCISWVGRGEWATWIKRQIARACHMQENVCGGWGEVRLQRWEKLLWSLDKCMNVLFHKATYSEWLYHVLLLAFYRCSWIFEHIFLSPEASPWIWSICWIKFNSSSLGRRKKITSLAYRDTLSCTPRTGSRCNNPAALAECFKEFNTIHHE